MKINSITYKIASKCGSLRTFTKLRFTPLLTALGICRIFYEIMMDEIIIYNSLNSMLYLQTKIIALQTIMPFF